MNEEIRRLTRHARRAMQFPADAQCSACGESDVRALIHGTGNLTCYRCRAVQKGLTGMEAHHIGGRQNGDLTVDIPANDHRVLSDMQQDWSTETLRNPTGSPLIAVAATLRGWLDVLKLLIDRAVGWIPDALESLDACIQAALGEWWWEQREFAAFTAAVRGVLHA